MPVDMGFFGGGFPGSTGSGTGSGYFEEDPYEQTENNPGYGSIVGSTPQQMDYMGMFNNMVPQAVINSWIPENMQTLENMDPFQNAMGISGDNPYGFEQGDNFWGWTGGEQQEDQAQGWAGSWQSPSGGGGGSGPGDIEWELGDYDVGGNGPDWWRPFKVKDDAHLDNPMVSSTLMMNALIGSGALSEEDSRSMAKQLFTMWGAGNETQGAENPWDLYSAEYGDREDLEGGPTMQGSFDPFISEQQAALGQTGPGIINEGNMFGTNRAQQSISALDAMSQALYGGDEHKLGSGYEYLKQVAATLGEGGENPTRAERQQVLGALDPMMAMSQGGGELGAFGAMAQMLANPFYTNLPPNASRTQSGDYQFGRQNNNLFF